MLWISLDLKLPLLVKMFTVYIIGFLRQKIKSRLTDLLLTFLAIFLLFPACKPVGLVDKDSRKSFAGEWNCNDYENEIYK